MYDKANAEQKSIVKKGVEIRNEELLDLYNQSIEGDSPKIINKRNKAIKKIKKNKY